MQAFSVMEKGRAERNFTIFEKYLKFRVIFQKYALKLKN